MDRRVKPQKHCFVTIGATAAFGSLIKAIVSPAFLQALGKNGYTTLRLQYGRGGAAIMKECLACTTDIRAKWSDLKISGFDFDREGLTNEMKAAEAGIVISHAGLSIPLIAQTNADVVGKGSGSVLEALRLAVPLIVVPNPSLLDNHQVELAEEMATQGYAVHGNLEFVLTLPQFMHRTNIFKQTASCTERSRATPAKNASMALKEFSRRWQRAHWCDG